MARKRAWYAHRTWRDAPSDMADPAFTTYGAWAAGYNAAVQAYLDEISEVLRRERGTDIDTETQT